MKLQTAPSVWAARVPVTPAAPQLRIIAHRSLSSRAVRLCPPARPTFRVSSRCGIAVPWGSLNNIPRRCATSTTPRSTVSDPADVEAVQCLEKGTQKFEDDDFQGAKELYKRSVEIKRSFSTLFNLGVAHYHLKEFDDAISAWRESIALQPMSADAHTSLASAYIMSPVSRPDLALHHLHIAASLSPEDPEIAFKIAAVLEAAGQLEEALEYYKRSKENGVERAAMHIQNVSAKVLGKQMQVAAAEDKSKKSDS